MCYKSRVTPDGCTTEQLDHVPNLEEAQAIVGGLVEVVHPRRNPGLVMLVNEEGWIHNLPLNMAGSTLYGGPLAGDVVVIDRKEPGAGYWC